MLVQRKRHRSWLLCRARDGLGVDVEPDYSDPRDIDTKTGNLEFRNCSFNDNISAFLTGYIRTNRGYLRLIDCTSSKGGNHPNHMILSWPGATISGGLYDAGAGTIWVAWEAGVGSDVQIRDCEVRTSGPYGIYHPHDGNQVRLERVRLIGSRRKSSHGSILWLGGNPGGGKKNLLRSCEVFIPAPRKSPEHAYDYEVVLHHRRAGKTASAPIFRARAGSISAQNMALARWCEATVIAGPRPGPPTASGRRG